MSSAIPAPPYYWLANVVLVRPAFLITWRRVFLDIASDARTTEVSAD
jgi:hypothetical protein